MELYDFLDAAVADLEPMPDLVPAVHRIGQRKQRQRLAGLGAAGAAFVIGVGTLVIAAPWSAGAMNPGSGGQVLSEAAYAKLLTSTLQSVWPKQAAPGGLESVMLRFGSGDLPVWSSTGLPTEPVQASMSMAQVSGAEAAKDQQCPVIPAAEQRTYFCTETTLAGGAVVQVSNSTEVLIPAKGQLPQAAPFQYEHMDPRGVFDPVGPNGEVEVYGIEEVTVWLGDAEEQLYVPMLDSIVSWAMVDGVKTRIPTADEVSNGFRPSIAELIAIGASSQFQQLLSTALTSGFIPPAGEPGAGAMCGAPAGATRPTSAQTVSGPLSGALGEAAGEAAAGASAGPLTVTLIIACGPVAEGVQPLLTFTAVPSGAASATATGSVNPLATGTVIPLETWSGGASSSATATATAPATATASPTATGTGSAAGD